MPIVQTLFIMFCIFGLSAVLTLLVHFFTEEQLDITL